MTDDKQPVASISVVEERATLATTAIPISTVYVKTTTERSRQHVETPLEIQQVAVERVPMARWVDGPVEPRQVGDTTIFSVVEEVAVVERRFRLVEEVRVTRQTRSEQFADDVEVRRTHVSVERGEAKPSPGERT